VPTERETRKIKISERFDEMYREVMYVMMMRKM